MRLPSLGTRRALIVLLVCFCTLACGWALRVPVPVGAQGRAWSNFNPDEATHLAVIAYMAHHALQSPPYTREFLTSHHPPLYYVTGAAVYAAVEPLGGPRGATLALRLLSVLMGGATVYLVYRSVRVLTLSSGTALLAAGVVAGVPMFAAMSGAINNDALAVLTATTTLAVIVSGVRRGYTPGKVLLLALLVTANIATKVTGLGLLPVALLALWWDGRRRHLPLRTVAGRMASLLLVVAALMGWWFVRNALVYGDPLRQRMHEELMGQAQPGFVHLHEQTGISVGHYLVFATTLGWRSFWGAFDAQSRLFPLPLYVALALLQAATLVCVAGALVRRLRRSTRLWAAAAGLLGLFVALSALIYYRFNWAHLTPQGRYYFILMLPFGLATAVGWHGLFPRRYRPVGAAALLLALLILNLWTLLTMTHRPAVVPAAVSRAPRVTLVARSPYR